MNKNLNTHKLFWLLFSFLGEILNSPEPEVMYVKRDSQLSYEKTMDFNASITTGVVTR